MVKQALETVPPRSGGSVSDQILNQAPVGAHGYQVEVHTADGRVIFLPLELPKRPGTKDKPAIEFWTLRPYQIPLGVPEGRHRLIYVSPEGDAIGEAVLNYYPITVPLAAAAGSPDEPDLGAQIQAEQLKMQHEQQRIAARAQAILLADATAKNQAGLLANNQQMSQDAAEAYRVVLENAVAVATKATEAAAKLLEGHRALMDAAATHAKRVAESVPVPPPPPQDWASVAKEGVQVLGDVAATFGVARKRARQIEESSNALEVKETLPAPEEPRTDQREEASAKSDKSDPDDQDPPSGAAAPVSAASAKAAPPAKPVENKQQTAKRALRRVLQACASVSSGHALQFLREPALLRRFFLHLRFLLFPVTYWRWQPRLAA